MALGRSVRIYLADGSVSGIRHAEIANWTGQAVACSRAQFATLRSWPETRRPGVYFLFGVDEQTGREALYIGEAEVIIDRLSNHISGKDFWTDLITFTNKDDNLTKGHVRYLESRLLELALLAGRYVVTNAVTPGPSSLPRADKDAMEEFIANVQVLLGVLGHRALEPYAQRLAAEGVTQSTHQTEVTGSDASAEALYQSKEFHLSVANINATAVRTTEGIVVLAGSKVTRNPAASLSTGYRLLREQLIASQVISECNGVLQFSKDQLFSSPSQAAGIIVGYSINGRQAWRDDKQRTWAEVEMLDNGGASLGPCLHSS